MKNHLLKATILLLFLSTSTAYALLSPLNQSLEEIEAIIQNAELQKCLPQGQALKSIRRTGNGYLLTTDEIQLMAEIRYIPTERPGRQQFKVTFQDPIPLLPKP